MCTDCFRCNTRGEQTQQTLGPIRMLHWDPMLVGSVLHVYKNVTPGPNVGWVCSPRVSECYTGIQCWLGLFSSCIRMLHRGPMLVGSVLHVYKNVTPGPNVGWVCSPRVSECYTGTQCWLGLFSMCIRMLHRDPMLVGSVLLVYQNVTPGPNVGWVCSPRV